MKVHAYIRRIEGEWRVLVHFPGWHQIAGFPTWNEAMRFTSMALTRLQRAMNQVYE